MIMGWITCPGKRRFVKHSFHQLLNESVNMLITSYQSFLIAIALFIYVFIECLAKFNGEVPAITFGQLIIFDRQSKQEKRKQIEIKQT